MSNPGFISASPAITVSGKMYTATTTDGNWVQLTPSFVTIYGPITVFITGVTLDFLVTQSPTAPAGTTLARYVDGPSAAYAEGLPYYGTDPLWVKRASTDVMVVAHVPIDATGAPTV